MREGRQGADLGLDAAELGMDDGELDFYGNNANSGTKLNAVRPGKKKGGKKGDPDYDDDVAFGKPKKGSK
jgi:hypothetical protein